MAESTTADPRDFNSAPSPRRTFRNLTLGLFFDFLVDAGFASGFVRADEAEIDLVLAGLINIMIRYRKTASVGPVCEFLSRFTISKSWNC
jgi:hypothetical protein